MDIEVVRQKYMKKFNRDIEKFECSVPAQEAMKLLLEEADDEHKVDLFFILRDLFDDSKLRKILRGKE
jgi:hypothetical protein